MTPQGKTALAMQQALSQGKMSRKDLVRIGAAATERGHGYRVAVAAINCQRRRSGLPPRVIGDDETENLIVSGQRRIAHWAIRNNNGRLWSVIGDDVYPDPSLVESKDRVAGRKARVKIGG
jgi:hypothetical protein